MSAYLFVHFREKDTPDGEQVYFGLSRDGFHWEAVNGGQPVLWAYYGCKGARDFTICRSKLDGKFYIVATDLSLAYGMRNEYRGSWDEISRNGSKCLSVWESEDLVTWSEQRLVHMGSGDFGCVWAPDVIFDDTQGDYVLHWSSSHKRDGYKQKAIYFSRTKDFASFTPPKLLYKKEDSGVIDSAMVREGDAYYLFLKSEGNPERVILLRGPSVTGPFERVAAFDESMTACAEGLYEAPTAVKLPDGRWLLFVDYYGVRGAGQGYVPFVSENLASGRFARFDQARGDNADAPFTFPYGFKHGTILPITDEEYERIRAHDWNKE